MRSTFIAVAVVIGFMPGVLRAQTAPGVGKPAVDVNKAILAAAEKIGREALKPGVSVSDRNISVVDAGAYNVTVAFVTRPPSTTPSGSTLAHDKITEIYYVLRGSGTSVTGAMADATHEPGSTTIGPGYRSAKPIANGRSVKLGPGEMQIIPPGLGHVWSEIADGGIDYLVIRVDPEHVLALSK
jgi:mannose-6-phosphate isomerase-like protein (cupin superfamily)